MESLRESDAISRSLYVQTIAGHCQLDVDGRIVRANARFCEMLGYSLAELRGMPIDELTHSDDRQKEHDFCDRLIEGCLNFHSEKRYVRKDCEQIWVLTAVSAIRDANNQIEGVALVCFDITNRKQVKELLRRSEEQMRAIVDSVADAIIAIDPRGTIVAANNATEAIFGYDVDWLVGRNVNLLFPMPMILPLAAQQGGCIARHQSTDGASSAHELVGHGSDGSTLAIELTVTEVRSLGLFTAIIRDTSVRRELEQQVTQIVEEEDRRIGSELHDSIQQQLTGIAMLACSLADSLDVQSSNCAPMARHVAEEIQETSRQVHLLAHGLVPVEIEADELGQALTGLANEVNANSHIQCTCSFPSEFRVGDRSVATNLYRICQEAVGNALKHSQAKRIEIRLDGDDQTISASVQDNGVGFKPLQSSSAGIGLRIMAYRADLIGGKIEIEPAESGGVHIRCRLPRAAIQSD